MLTQEIIIKKRDGSALSSGEIDAFCRGVTDGSVSEGQIAAFCMAVFLNKLNREERVALTLSMARSGIVLDWSDLGLNGPVLDKHSTGGVGDKISLMLAPVVAACGAYVPMISGRGLGHSGGTLDKMDAIPGYNSQPDLSLFRQAVKEAGCAIIGATKDIAPADRALYRVRDVTGSVESMDLITASILSKKLAAGLQGLIMDVKFGTGAFMQDYAAARDLASNLVSVANGAGLPTIALMTDMNQVLGRTAGNGVEVREAVEFLRGENIDPRLYETTMALCADLLVLGKIAATPEAARLMAEEKLESGHAAAVFSRMVKALGGPGDIIEKYDRHLGHAPIRHEVRSPENGVPVHIDTRALGLAVIELGGGRRVAADKIDHSVGLTDIAALGEDVGPTGRPLAVIWGRDQAKVSKAEAMIRAAYKIGPASSFASMPLIRERITA